MEISAILRDLTVVLAIATGVAILFGKLRISVIPAFLIAGAILGPTAAGLVSEPAMVDVLAEIGVAMFLFTIGLDLSVSRLGKMPRKILWAGAAQVSATVLCILVVLLIARVPVPEALFIGFVLSLSSTAIVLKVYTDRMEMDTSQGRISLGVLVFQDLAAIPMMLLVLPLRQWEAAQASAVLPTLLKAAAAVGGLLLLARFAIPRLLREVVKLNSRDVLAMTVLLVCLGTAFVARQIGLSIGMGAFLAGMVISESDYVHEIAAQIMPFRDVLIGVAFIAFGMLLDLPFVGRHIPLVLAVLAGVALLKALASGAAIRALGFSWRVAAIAGIGIAQIGEFSFLLLSEGYREGLIGPAQYQTLLAATILTMTATPFLMGAAPGAGWRVERWMSRWRGVREEPEDDSPAAPPLENHVIISGYGMNGKNLARVLRATRLPYVVVDLNNVLVREGKEAGEPMFFGDVNSPGILERVGIRRARMLVLAISDPMATRRAVAVARHTNPELFILVRTRYVADVDDLLSLGASAVIPEEFETSVEIFARVLAEYHVPEHIVRQQEGLIRSGAYKILRERTAPSSGEVLAEFEEFLRKKVIEVFYVSPDSGWAGRRVEELPVGGETGIVLLSILRGDRALIQPDGEEILAVGDKLVLFGGHAPLAAALTALMRPSPPAGEGVGRA
ncbi:MAG: cation:proton antiporter [Deltaproteobacteria bacterium]|nr:cation:proton antiporter [Deltaproteobacteria bacterium]